MPIPDWRALEGATDKHAAVEKLFTAALCEDDADRQLLGRMMKRFKGLEAPSAGGLELHFGGSDSTETLFISPPFEDEPAVPIDSLRALSRSFNLSRDGAGGGELSSYPGFQCDNLPDFVTDDEDDLREAMGEVERDELIGVFDCDQNLIVGHPTLKNSRGEPILYFVDHGDGVPHLIDAAKSLTARQVLLRLLADVVLGEPAFEEVKL